MFLGNFLHKPNHILISASILLDPTRIKLVMSLLSSKKQDQDPYSSGTSYFSTPNLHQYSVLKLVE